MSWNPENPTSCGQHRPTMFSLGDGREAKEQNDELVRLGLIEKFSPAEQTFFDHICECQQCDKNQPFNCPKAIELASAMFQEQQL